MTKNEVMLQLEQMGSEQTKKTFLRHGAKEPLFGVKIGDMKKIQKKVKKNYDLSLQLFETGNADAMYLAGLITDETKITKKNLQYWVKNANWSMISEYTVAWIAAESKYGYELAVEWIDSKQENIASAGWSTLSNLCAIKPDEELNIEHLKKLLNRVVKEINTAANRVRYTMNGFVIAAGSYVKELTEKALETAKQIGIVSVNIGDTAYKVPIATHYIKKIAAKGNIGKKKKEARC